MRIDPAHPSPQPPIPHAGECARLHGAIYPSPEPMSSSPSPLERFIERFTRDLDRLEVQPLAHYLREFPGDDSGIAQEYRALLVPSEGPEGDLPGEHHASWLNPDEAQQRTLGPFQILRAIGQGGQGTVYEAIDVRLGRRVALKTMAHRGLALTQIQERFSREAKMAARLQHPGICSVHDFGEVNGTAYISMEFIEGRTLKTLIEQGEQETTDQDAIDAPPLRPSHSPSTHLILQDSGAPDEASPPQTEGNSSTQPTRQQMIAIAALFEDIARALHAAHEVGILHRDIKPGNIMVRSDGSPVVLDFGLARSEDEDLHTLTREGDVFGTPAYMSPEQISGATHAIDRRTDVWAIGVCLFEAVTMHRPFEGTTTAALANSITSLEEVEPRRINPRIPRDLATIISTALAKTPDHRYASAADLADELQRFAASQPIQARPAGPWLRTQRWAERNPAVACSLAVVILVLSAATALTSRAADDARRALASESRALMRMTEARKEESSALAEKTRALTAETKALTEKTEALRSEEAERRAKEKALLEYQRLADTKLLANAKARSDALWPVTPDLEAGLLRWQKEFGALLKPETLAGHEDALERLRKRAEPYTDQERKRDFADELAEIARLEGDEPKLVQAIEAETDAEKKKAGEEQLAGLRSRLAELCETVNGQRTWRFASNEDEFRHEILAQLVTDLRAFTSDNQVGAQRSIADRLMRARRIEELTVTGEAVAKRWRDAIARIRSNDRYRLSPEDREKLGPIAAPESLFDVTGAMTLVPQVGLVPLGPDPVSDLEEFLHLETHEHDWANEEISLPQRRALIEEDPRGGIVMTPDTGVILVLLPAGSFLMGSQKDDPEKPNFDPGHEPREGPLHEVPLGGYFLSKYELTQGQWARGAIRTLATEPRPSEYGPGSFDGGTAILPSAVDGTHPVEHVDWPMCSEWVARAGLLLPTEAQWERAARATTPSLIWSGVGAVGDLTQVANISGQETAGPAPSWPRSPEHRDRFVVHAPVGSFGANGFGLHDMSGNVWEWCRDWSAHYDVATSSGDGLRSAPSRPRVNRGGSFRSPASSARVASRLYLTPTFRSDILGIRPSRAITTK